MATKTKAVRKVAAKTKQGGHNAGGAAKVAAKKPVARSSAPAGKAKAVKAPVRKAVPGKAKPVPAKAPTKAVAREAAPKKPAAKKVPATKAPAKPKIRPKAKAIPPSKRVSLNHRPKARTSAPEPKIHGKQFDSVRKMLLELQSRLARQIHALRDDSLKRNDEVNPSEDGTDAFERQFALTLASSETDALFEVEDALRRLDEERYGVCETCEANIGVNRLMALPFVRLCIECQSEAERLKGPHRQSAARRGL